MIHRERDSAPSSGPLREAGFTLIEAVVSLAIMVVVLVGLLALLEFNSRVARSQVNVSEMQQSVRVAQADIVRTVRMAGRGGLPVSRPATEAGYPGMSMPQGTAIGVANNVPDGTTIGGGAGAAVVPGTAVGAAVVAEAESPPSWSLPCAPTTVVVGGTTYYQCGSAWYVRSYSDGEIAYVIVNPPAGY